MDRERRDPFRDVERVIIAVSNAIEDLVERSVKAVTSIVPWRRYYVYEDDDTYRIYVEIPGAEKDSIELFVETTKIFVKARNAVDAPHLPKEYRVRIELRDPIDVDSARARYVNGILVIEARKKVSGRKISVE